MAPMYVHGTQVQHPTMAVCKQTKAGGAYRVEVHHRRDAPLHQRVADAQVPELPLDHAALRTGVAAWHPGAGRAQSATPCILSVTTAGPIPLQPWSVLGLHPGRTRASCIRHTKALARALLKWMPTESPDNTVRPHHAHYARDAGGKRAPLAEARAGRGAARTHHLPARASRACALASSVSWRFCSHTRSSAFRQRAVAGLRGSRACEAPSRQAVRAALHTLRPCGSAVYQRRAQARQSGCAGLHGQGLTRMTKAYATVRQPSTAPRRHTSAPTLGRRCGQQIRHAGRAAQPLHKSGEAAALLPSFARHCLCARTARLLATPSAPAHR